MPFTQEHPQPSLMVGLLFSLLKPFRRTGQYLNPSTLAMYLNLGRVLSYLEGTVFLLECDYYGSCLSTLSLHDIRNPLHIFTLILNTRYTLLVSREEDLVSWRLTRSSWLVSPLLTKSQKQFTISSFQMLLAMILEPSL